MWSKHARAGVDHGRRPAPRTPSKNELRPEYEGWSRTVVQARSSVVPSGGAGWSKRSTLYSTLTRKRVKGNRWESTWTGWTGHDQQASRPRVPTHRSTRARTGSSCLAARLRGSLLALRSSTRTWRAVRRRPPGPGWGTCPVEPCTRVCPVQSSRRRTARRCDHERAALAWCAARARRSLVQWTSWWRRARAVVIRVAFFSSRRYPRLRLQQQLLPLKLEVDL